MGIQGLTKVIRDNCINNQIIEYHLHELCGLKIAVDISIFLYKYIRTCGEIEWMNNFFLLLCTLKKHGISAVCIFDGPNPPIEKKGEQLIRIEKNNNDLRKLDICRQKRDQLLNDYIIPNHFPSKELLSECVELLGKRKKSYTNTFNLSDVFDALNEVIRNLERQTIPITSKHKKLAKEIVDVMGLHAIEADGEAETLCCYLAINGKVDAVLTEDTDVLAYGTPFMLAFKNFTISDEKLYGIHLPSVLEDLDMDQETFRDLCILLGCDYNQHKRVKGFPPHPSRNFKKPVSLGEKYAYLMVKEYGLIEDFYHLLVIDDPNIFNYTRYRELLTIPRYISDCMVPYSRTPDYEKVEEFLNEYELFIGLDYIYKCHPKQRLIIEDDDSDELLSLSDDEI